jgi:hypothetical protein
LFKQAVAVAVVEAVLLRTLLAVLAAMWVAFDLPVLALRVP